MKSAIGTVIFIPLLLGLVIPSNAQWIQANNGLYGGAISSTAVIGSNLFVGTAGGVFLSTDNGSTWSFTSDLETQQESSISLVTIGSNLFAANVGGVSTSSDLGAHWTVMNSGLGVNILSLATDGTNLIAASYGGGVFLSTNNASSWSAVNSGIANLNIQSVGVGGSTWFASDDQGGSYASTNQGASWTTLNTGLANTKVVCYASVGNSLFMGAMGGGILISSNGGTNWSPVNNGLESSFVNDFLVIGTTLYAATNFALYASSDNGSHWTSTNLRIGVSALERIGTNLFAGSLFNGPGIFLSTDNASTWAPINSGLTNTLARSLFSVGNTILAGLDGQGVYLSGNNGGNWTLVNAGLTIINDYVTTCFDTLGSNIFMGSNFNGVLLSVNGGTSWTAVNSGLTNLFVTSLTHVGMNLFAGTWDGGVYLSNNLGASWTAVNTGLTNFNINSLVAFGGNLFAATRSGVFRFSDSGTSWTEVSTGLTDTYIYSLAVIGPNLFASTASQGVFMSNDNGANWTSASGFPTFHSMAIADSTILAVSDFAIYASKDYGNSWVLTDNRGLPNTYQFSSLTILGSNVFLGTDYNGVWYRPLTDLVKKSDQLIAFNQIADVTIGGPQFILGATASSGLAVTYSSSSGKVTLNGSAVNIVSAGRDTITAIQKGNNIYYAAPSVRQSFCVIPAKPTVVLSNANTASPALVSDTPSGNQWYKDGTAIGGATGQTLTISDAGVYAVQVKVDDCSSAFSNDIPIVASNDTSFLTTAATLFPNPAVDFIYLNGVSPDVYESNVMDMMGRNTHLVLENQQGLIKADVSNLSSGLYILSFSEGNEIHHIKFFKQ